MLEITTHRFPGFSRKEFWFYNTEKITKGTYNVFCLTLEKDLSTKKNILKQQTSLIDLKETAEKLFEAVNRTFKFQIRKAEKIGVTAHIYFDPTVEKCKEVTTAFALFAKEKSIEWSSRRIFALQKIGRLVISEARFENEVLVTHIYLHDTRRITLLHSLPSKKTSNQKLRGYANKFLHWQDILAFKKHGLIIYDFGGINREKLPGISDFKLSFGGNLVDSYSYIESPKIISFLKSLLKR